MNQYEYKKEIRELEIKESIYRKKNRYTKTDDICRQCNGSGEGYVDGSTCTECFGTGCEHEVSDEK